MQAQKPKTETPEYPEKLFEVMKIIGVNQKFVDDMAKFDNRIGPLDMSNHYDMTAIIALLGYRMGQFINKIPTEEARPLVVMEGCRLYEELFRGCASIGADGFPMSVFQEGADRNVK